MSWIPKALLVVMLILSVAFLMSWISYPTWYAATLMVAIEFLVVAIYNYYKELS